MYVTVSNNLYFIMLGKLAAVILYRFSISLKFILIDFNFRSTGKEIMSLARS